MNTVHESVSLPEGGVLESLLPEEREFIKGLGEFVSFGTGETVISEGSEQDYLHILISGSAKVLEKAIAPAVTAWIKGGDSFGEVNLFDLDEKGASASVVAAEDCLIWKIDRVGVNSFFEARPEASLRLLIGISTLLSKRLRAMNKVVQDMAVWTRA